MPSIAEYLDPHQYPRFGQCFSSTERVSGVGPCVQIFDNDMWFGPEGYSRILQGREPWTRGIKLFDDGDNIKFLLNLQGRHYVALSSRAISVFNAALEAKGTEKLCDGEDETIGHGKIEDLDHKREVDGYLMKDTYKFQLIIVFKSGYVHRLSITAVSLRMDLKLIIKKEAENKSAAGTLIAAPIMDKTSLVMIYDDTIVKADMTVCRGSPAEGRQVVFAVGTPWKSKIFLVTDDGEVHYAKMMGKVGDGKMSLFGTGKVIVSSSGLEIKEPTAFTVWRDEVVVGNKNGDLFRLNKKDFRKFDEHEMEYGPITFLQGHGEDIWIGSKEGIIQKFDYFY